MVHSFPKGTRPLVDPLRGNIPLAGVHFRALLAPVTVLLHGAKSWQLLAASRPAWARLSAAGRGLRPGTPPQAGPTRQPSCGPRAAGRANGQPPSAGPAGGHEGDGHGQWKRPFEFPILVRHKTPSSATIDIIGN